MVQMGPAKTSNSSSKGAAVTGAVVAALVVLLVITVFAVYVFKKRRILIIRYVEVRDEKLSDPPNLVPRTLILFPEVCTFGTESKSTYVRYMK